MLNKIYSNYHLVDGRNNRDCGYIEGVLRSIYSNIYKIYRLIRPDVPYFTPKSISYLDQFLKKEMLAFEWGSGKSTTWIGKRIKKLISIEHDKYWFSKISKELSNKNIKNTDYVYISPSNKNDKADLNYPGIKHLKSLPGKEVFLNYCNAINKYDNEVFDIIFIDGRERIGCFANAIDKLKKGGIILLDDSFRVKYSPIFDLVKDWNIFSYDFGYLQTTIFSKPL